MYFKTDFYEKNFAVTLILTLAIVVLTVIANVGVFKRKEMLAFLASGLTLVVLVALLFSGLFPRVMIGSEGFDLLIKDATSTPYTLKIMTWISLSILPFVLAYTAWSYYIFRKRISQTAVPEGIKSMIDKDILQMPKIKNSCLACRFSFLQAVFIIGQAFFFQKPLSAFGVAGILTNNYRVFYSFYFYLGRHVITYFRERMLDTFSYERSKELREQLLTKIFRLGPNVVQKWNWKYGYHGFRRHQSNRKLFTIDFDKNDEYDDYSLDYFGLCFTQDIRSGITLLIVFRLLLFL